MYLTLKIKKIIRFFVFPLTAAIAVTTAAVCGSGRAAVDAAAQRKTRNVAVIMYHSILRDSSRQGKYVISPAQLEEDLQYLTSHGYTCVTVSDLEAFVYQGKDLPEKPVMLTFDDGYYNNYLYAYPLIKKYNCKMVLSIVGVLSERFSETDDENAYYSHCTWDEITEMIDSGVVEIQNHSYNLHSYGSKRHGCAINKGEDLAAYSSMLISDTEKAQNLIAEKTGVTPSAYTYPFGATCKEARNIIKDLGFKASFSCEGRIYSIATDKESLYDIPRWNRPAGKDSRTYFENTLHLDKYFGG